MGMDGFGQFADHRLMLIAGVILAQAADVITTVIGLRNPAIVELNPVANIFMDAVGIEPGLVLLSGTSIAIVVGLVEGAVRLFEDRQLSPRRLRYLCYLPHIAISSLATANNIVVIAVA